LRGGKFDQTIGVKDLMENSISNAVAPAAHPLDRRVRRDLKLWNVFFDIFVDPHWNRKHYSIFSHVKAEMATLASCERGCGACEG
jgi:hypothetical protein